jgi:transcriptional regulator with XRE-family HTH domain
VPRASQRDRIVSELARIVASIRSERGFSKNGLAERAGLSIAAVRFIENGSRRPTLDSLLRIAEGLDVDLWEMLRAATRAANTDVDAGEK